MVHPHCSILSAFGVRLSDHSVSHSRSFLQPLSPQSLQDLEQWQQETAAELVEAFEDETLDDLQSELFAELRYLGTQSGIEIKFEPGSDLDWVGQEFEQRHLRAFGYIQNQRGVEIATARTTLTQPGNRLNLIDKLNGTEQVTSGETRTIQTVDGERDYQYFKWATLTAGDRVDGPAMIASDTTTVIVDPNWQAEVQSNGVLLLVRHVDSRIAAVAAEDGAMVDPVKLEIFNRSFQSIATQMGDSLRKTSVSVNVKERLDYSCALFCDRGELVANAPHIPVHLGAMSESVRTTIELNKNIRQGDVFVTNDPFQGGSHLPDVTVITPVFLETDAPAFWLASRSHHAEIGGMAPGSMPTDATCLEQEGVLIQNFKLVEAGRERLDALRKLLQDAKFPSRSPNENIDDIRAQIAANQSGVAAVLALRDRFGWTTLQSYMQHVRSAAASKARRAIRQLADGVYVREDAMDDGTVVRVEINKADDRLAIDFSGSGSVHSGNLNANPSIVKSAVMYLLRCLVAQDIPLNAGLLEPVTIQIPDGFLNPRPGEDAASTPAVVGGNVETSQRIVDVLLGALELAAASQGTMNNWLIGDDSFGYYETVGGGGGATVNGPGADAVHCHMSNTRLTDPSCWKVVCPSCCERSRCAAAAEAKESITVVTAWSDALNS